MDVSRRRCHPAGMAADGECSCGGHGCVGDDGMSGPNVRDALNRPAGAASAAQAEAPAVSGAHHRPGLLRSAGLHIDVAAAAGRALDSAKQLPLRSAANGGADARVLVDQMPGDDGGGAGLEAGDGRRCRAGGGGWCRRSATTRPGQRGWGVGRRASRVCDGCGCACPPTGCVGPVGGRWLRPGWRYRRRGRGGGPWPGSAAGWGPPGFRQRCERPRPRLAERGARAPISGTRRRRWRASGAGRSRCSSRGSRGGADGVDVGGHRHRLSYPVRSSHLDSVRTVLIALSPPRAALVLPPCQPLLMAWSPGARGSRLGWHDQQPSGQPGRSRGESKHPRSARVGVGAEQSARREGTAVPAHHSGMGLIDGCGQGCLGVGLPLVVAAIPLPRHAAGSECFAVTDGDGRADLADELLDMGGTGR